MIEIDSKVVTCLRDGIEDITHVNNLKVGDIIKVSSGMNIPVDGLVCNGVGIMADESVMTGESDHLPKESFKKCLQR